MYALEMSLEANKESSRHRTKHGGSTWAVARTLIDTWKWNWVMNIRWNSSGRVVFFKTYITYDRVITTHRLQCNQNKVPARPSAESPRRKWKCRLLLACRNRRGDLSAASHKQRSADQHTFCSSCVILSRFWHCSQSQLVKQYFFGSFLLKTRNIRSIFLSHLERVESSIRKAVILFT